MAKRTFTCEADKEDNLKVYVDKDDNTIAMMVTVGLHERSVYLSPAGALELAAALLELHGEATNG